MKISMYAMSVEVMVPMLQNLSAILDKGLAHANTKGFDPAVLAGARLAPDMFPLVRQVQIAADMAKNGVARLAGQEPARFDDTETTLEQLKERIERTIGYIRNIEPQALEGSEDRDIKVPLRDRTIELKGLAFLQRWVLPNFFFHVTTAYNLLRHNGADIGKRDYLGPV